MTFSDHRESRLVSRSVFSKIGDVKAIAHIAVFLGLMMVAQGQDEPDHIRIYPDAIRIGGIEFVPAPTASALQRALGEPDRIARLRRIIHTWDEKGIYAHERVAGDPLMSIVVRLRKTVTGLEFAATGLFQGTVIVDGKTISSSTTRSELKKYGFDVSRIPALQLGQWKITAHTTTPKTGEDLVSYLHIGFRGRLLGKDPNDLKHIRSWEWIETVSNITSETGAYTNFLRPVNMSNLVEVAKDKEADQFRVSMKFQPVANESFVSGSLSEAAATYCRLTGRTLQGKVPDTDFKIIIDFSKMSDKIRAPAIRSLLSAGGITIRHIGKDKVQFLKTPDPKQ